MQHFLYFFPVGENTVEVLDVSVLRVQYLH